MCMTVVLPRGRDKPGGGGGGGGVLLDPLQGHLSLNSDSSQWQMLLGAVLLSSKSTQIPTPLCSGK